MLPRGAAHLCSRLAVDHLLLHVALEHGVAIALAEHGLAVHDLRLAGARLHAVLALHAVDDDLEVELAHAADQRLPGVGIFTDAERGILLAHLAQGEVEPFLGGGVLGLDRLRDHRLVGVDALEQDRRARIAERVAGRRVLEAGGGDDLTCDRLLEALALVRVDAEQARDLLLAVRADVEHSSPA
jgi:hypothetical protein